VSCVLIANRQGRRSLLVASQAIESTRMCGTFKRNSAS